MGAPKKRIKTIIYGAKKTFKKRVFRCIFVHLKGALSAFLGVFAQFCFFKEFGHISAVVIR